MTKAIAMLKYLSTQRKLKEVCKALDISYVFVHAITKETSSPSYKIIQSLMPIIPPSLWFEEADNAFLKDLTKE